MSSDFPPHHFIEDALELGVSDAVHLVYEVDRGDSEQIWLHWQASPTLEGSVKHGSFDARASDVDGTTITVWYLPEGPHDPGESIAFDLVTIGGPDELIADARNIQGLDIYMLLAFGPGERPVTERLDIATWIEELEVTCTEPVGAGLVRSFLEFGGVEIANGARTMAYIQLGLAGAHWSVTADGCACAVLFREAANGRYIGEWSSAATYASGDVVHHGQGGPSEGHYVFSGGEGSDDDVEPGTDPVTWPALFRAPELDTAPWYDPTRPESADFLGLLIADSRPFTDDTTTRQVSVRSGGIAGASLSPPHRDAQQWRISGTLVARSHAGVEYGRRWLAAILSTAPGCDNCGLSDVRVRTFCPPCDASADDHGEYLLYDSALTNGVRAITQQPEAFDFQDVEFELTSGNGWLYKRPADLASGTVSSDVCADTGDFCTWFSGVPTPVCGVLTPTSGVIGTVGVVVEVAAGSGGVPGPLDIYVLDSGGVGVQAIHVGGIPPNSTWIFDSARHETLLIDPAGLGHDGAPYLLLDADTAIHWIELSHCSPEGVQVCASVATFCAAAGDAVVRMSLQEREA